MGGVVGSGFGVALAVLAFSTLPALSNGKDGTSKPRFAMEYGSTLPPVGFVKFCGLFPTECDHQASIAHLVNFSGENWAKLVDVNSYVNHRIKPVSDQQLYGEPEVWTYPTDAGDCEDYLLLKKKYLESMGFASDSLLITVVLDERGDGHAVLTVATDDGDYILDNRRNDILRWSNTGYTFVKRQSAQNARHWVALAKQKNQANTQITSGNPR